MLISIPIKLIKNYLKADWFNCQMPKDKFLLINLKEERAKKITEVISSDTSRKILDYLAEQEGTEQKISEKLNLPISTAHYHLQKLVECGLVVIEEFHYSRKGREINHYKLANKYIIITPKPVSGIKQKLKNILPAILGVLGISAIIKILTISQKGTIVQKPADFAVEKAMLATGSVSETTTKQLDIALWFLVGGLAAIAIYLIWALFNKKN